MKRFEIQQLASLPARTYDARMDKTALLITLAIALIAASLAFMRLYFSGQSWLTQ